MIGGDICLWKKTKSTITDEVNKTDKPPERRLKQEII